MTAPPHRNQHPRAGPAGAIAGHTAWHRLDPLTRLVVAVGTVLAAVILGGVWCPLLLAVVAVMVPAAVARELASVLRTSLLLSLPLAVSVVVVNVLFAVGTRQEGLALAAEVLVRVLTMAGAVVLFYATTRPSRLVASLQFHGLPARATFVIHNGVVMIPRLMDRAREVTAAQRARGLDTEGRVWRRARGVLAVAAPTVLGALHEAEARTLALETRGFTRPGRPTLLWLPHDSRTQHLARWGIAIAVLLLAVARLAGVPLPC